MNFEVRESTGEYYDYAFRYSVYLDDREVWFDDYKDEQDITKIFMDFVKAIHEDGETHTYIKEVLKERN